MRRPRMGKCARCGLLDPAGPAGPLCVRFNVTVREPEADTDCDFFFATVLDGDKPYSPREHLVLQEAELRSRGMKGPV